jgi:glycosyltransferase involved in cell wall biosynthesis
VSLTVTPIDDQEQLGLERGSVAVCVPIGTAHAQALATVRSIAEHRDAATPVILAGSATALERMAEEPAVATGDLALLGLAVEGDGQGEAVNAEVEAVKAMMRASFPADVAVVAPGVVLTSDWLERLRAAGRSDSTVASATPLSLGVGGVALFDAEVPSRQGFDAEGSGQRGEPSDAEEAVAAPQLEDLEEAARRVRERSLRLYPRIATVGGGCAYIRRGALELAGPLEESCSLAQALARFAQRALALGMIHVAADDVLIGGSHRAHGSGGQRHISSEQDEDSVEDDPVEEEPVEQTIANDERGPLRRATNRARAALSVLSVTIDARALVAAVGGTQTYIIELVLALARRRAVSVRVLVPPDLSKRAADAFGAVAEIELLTYEQAVEGASLSDVVHRPQQVFTPDDLRLLRLVGERVVIGHQDLIAYHNHTYLPDVESWRSYRRTTRLALAGADQVIFFSEHARADALAEDLLQAGRTHVVGIASEALERADSHAEPGTLGSADGPPAALSEDEPFLLCLGADYAHKNRPFAIELLGALRRLGWPGRLVLAGAHVPHGSSREHEQKLLGKNPDLAEHVLDVGPVDEPGKRWLYGHARALVYPTTYEGFGLLPLEAARAGLPCLFAAQASLPELAGAAATLIAWDATASAAAVLALLSEGPAREEHLARLRALPIPSWDEVAERLVAIYEQAASAAPSEAAPRTWQELDRESYLVVLDRNVHYFEGLAKEYQDAYHALEGRVSTGLPLIDEGGLLSHEQQRGLMRVAARRGLGKAVLAPFGLLGRLGDDGGEGPR